MTEVPQKVLLIQFRRLGDAVLVTPVFDALRDAWPKTEVHLLTEFPVTDLFTSDPRVDRIWTRPARGGLPELVRQLRKEKFGLVFDFQSLPITSFLAWSTGGATVGFERRFRKYGTTVKLTDHRGSDYAADHKLDLLRAVGLSPSNYEPRLLPDLQPAELWSAAGDQPRVVLMPVSPWAHKRWSGEAFAETARQAHQETGAFFGVIGGPGEGAEVEEVGAQLAEVPHQTHVATSIGELLNLLAGAEVFLGNDNGPRHMAAALGLPTLGWFKDINPTHWTLPGSRHPVLWDTIHAEGRPVQADRVILAPEPEVAAKALTQLIKSVNATS